MKFVFIFENGTHYFFVSLWKQAASAVIYWRDGGGLGLRIVEKTPVAVVTVEVSKKRIDHKLHGGDVNRPELLEFLRDTAPLYVVRGNNDKEWAEDLPVKLAFSIGSMNFFMVHNKKDVPDDLGDAQIAVFGYSHKYFMQQQNGRLWLNPGSCGKRRYDQIQTLLFP